MKKNTIFSAFIAFIITLNLLPAFADNLQSGINALKNNNLNDALKYITLSIKENKNAPEPLYYLALTLKRMGDKQRAQKAFEAALRLNPQGDIKKQINVHLSSLNAHSSELKATSKSQIRKVNTGGTQANYLEHITPNGKVVRWDISKMPLKVYIHSGSGIKGYNSSFRNEIVKALNSWQRAMKNKIRFVTINSPQKADMKITWVETFQSHRIGENPFVALKDVILRSDINISTSMPGDRDKTPDEVYTVILHELAHALGFQGHSPFQDDVMYYSLSSDYKNKQLTERDINTMKMLYQLDADVSNNLPLDMAKTKEFYRLQLTAEKEIMSNNFKNALNYYHSAEKIYDKDFLVNFNMGVCYTNLNDYSNAINYYEKADTITPYDTMVRYNLAIAQVQLANSMDPYNQSKLTYFQKALDNLNSIKNKPDSPQDAKAMRENLQQILSNH